MDSHKRTSAGNPYLGVLASKKQKVEGSSNGSEQLSSSRSEGYTILNNQSSKKEIMSSQLSKLLAKQPQKIEIETTPQEALSKILPQQSETDKKALKNKNKSKEQSPDNNLDLEANKAQRVAILQEFFRKNMTIKNVILQIQKKHRVLYPDEPKHPFVVFVHNPDDFEHMLDILALFYHAVETPTHNDILQSTNQENGHPKLENVVLGFDCEFIGDKSVVGQKKAATIQLSTWKLSVVFWVANLKKLPACLENILMSREVLKVGVNSHEDATTVMYSFDCTVNGVIDVNYISLQLGYADSFLKLGELARIFVQEDKVDLKNNRGWHTPTPSRIQLQYAAHDAWLGFAILQKFYLKAKTTAEGMAESIHKLVKKKTANAVDKDVDLEAQKTFFEWAFQWDLTQEERDQLQKNLSKTVKKGTAEAVASIQHKLLQDESQILDLVKSLTKKAEEENKDGKSKKKKQKQEEPPADPEELSLDLSLHFA